MSTHSTIPTVKAQLVTKITTALATASPDGGQVQTSYAWPGNATAHESVFLGKHPAIEDNRTAGRHEDATIKAGRRQRQETYEVVVSVWVFRPDLTPTDAATAEARAFTIAGLIEDVFAADPLIGLAASVVQRVSPTDIASTLHPHEAGWACVLELTLDVAARLT